MKKFFILMTVFTIALVSLISCQEPEKIAPKISMNENFIPKESYSDAYPGYPYSPMTGAAYYIVLEEIGADNMMKCNIVYTNPKTGKPFSEMGKVFFNEKEEFITASFGPLADVQVAGTFEDFKIKFNEKFRKHGPSIVGNNRGSRGPNGYLFVVD